MKYIYELTDNEVTDILNTLPGHMFLEKCKVTIEKCIEHDLDDEPLNKFNAAYKNPITIGVEFVKKYRGVLESCEQYLLQRLSIRHVAYALCVMEKNGS